MDPQALTSVTIIIFFSFIFLTTLRVSLLASSFTTISSNLSFQKSHRSAENPALLFRYFPPSKSFRSALYPFWQKRRITWAEREIHTSAGRIHASRWGYLIVSGDVAVRILLQNIAQSIHAESREIPNPFCGQPGSKALEVDVKETGFPLHRSRRL